jgi:hypothetical protein
MAPEPNPGGALRRGARYGTIAFVAAGTFVLLAIAVIAVVVLLGAGSAAHGSSAASPPAPVTAPATESQAEWEAGLAQNGREEAPQENAERQRFEAETRRGEREVQQSP